MPNLLVGLNPWVKQAVSHSNGKGTAEVSSANYEARKYGVHAGMFMASAKERCPELIVVPYDFDRYQQVSEQVHSWGCASYESGGTNESSNI